MTSLWHWPYHRHCGAKAESSGKRTLVKRRAAMRTVDLSSNACRCRECVHLGPAAAQAIHCGMPQDKVTQVLCSKCASTRRDEANWTVSLGRETG
jgi:hypothetical protein